MIDVMLAATHHIVRPKKSKATRDRPGLKVGLAIHSLNHATSDMPTQIQISTSESASHSHPGWGSTVQYVHMLPRDMNDAKPRPITQYISASIMPPIVLAGL